MVAHNPPPPDYSQVHDDDDDSIPPPPPPTETDTFNDHAMEKTVSTNTAKPVRKWRMLKKEAEHVLVPQEDPENSVNMQGHFRGMHAAQGFEEEEAGMDEIEVPSSSVVARMNHNERKQDKRRKTCRVGLIGLVAIAVLIAIVTGSVMGTRGGKADTSSEVEEEEEKEIGNPNLDTDAAKFLLESDDIPESTKAALANGNSAVSKALDWLLNDDANAAYGFGEPNALDDDETKLNFLQRLTAGTLGKAFNSEGFTNNENWMSGQDVCTWAGIGCGQLDNNIDNGEQGLRRMQTDNVVTRINMNENNVVGKIPSEIALFKDLSQLVLYTNNISGPIPEEIFQLTSLTAIDLYGNNLTGPLSSKIVNLDKLKGIYLGKNSLTGQLPKELGELDSLESMWLGPNEFTGPIPVEITNLPNLQDFRAPGNQLTGGLPQEFENVATLQKLDLDYNEVLFDGQEFPMFLSDLENLERLTLRNTAMTGEMPAMVKGKFPSLTKLYLDGNNLTGELQNNLAFMQKMEVFTMSNNPQLGGVIPTDFGYMPNLQVLDLSDCRFEGEFSIESDEVPVLEEIHINGNSLDAISADITLLENLKKFIFDRNLIEAFPEDVCNAIDDGDIANMETLLGGCNIDCGCCTDVCEN